MEPLQREYFGWGCLFAPAIGLVAGRFSSSFRRSGPVLAAFVALASLYATAALFGFASGLVDAVITRKAAAPLEGAFSVLWGLTFLGYVTWMWPLAYLNHRLVARLLGPEEPPLVHFDLR